MNKREIVLSLLLVIIFGFLVFCLFTKTNNVNTNIPKYDNTSSTVEETILSTEIIEATTEPVVLSIEDVLFDKTIEYYKFDDKEILLANIEKCNSYIELLHSESLNYPRDLDKIEDEISRVEEIISAYSYDLKFIDKKILNVPSKYNSRDFKSYESYKAITSKNSLHYKLQNQYAVTGPEGIRKVNDRYCIALGSYFTTAIGQYVDIVLENGTVIPCILGDQKSDRHTDDLHIAHRIDGSIVEFIVDLSVLADAPRRMGNISYAYSEWRSPVVQIIVYNVNFFDEIAQ